MSIAFLIFAVIFFVIMLYVALLYGITRFTKTDGDILNQYDERQKIEQGKGYRAGFITMAALMLGYAVGYQDLDLPMETDLLLFLFVYLGLFVMTTWCIWRDAWFPLNGKKMRILMVNIPCSLLFIALGTRAIQTGAAFTDSKLNLNCVLLLVGIFMLAEYIVALLRRFALSRHEREE